MSPVFILSRLCLKRRFQFFGISVPPLVRYLTTFLTASSSITLRRPTSSAFSAGTFTVMSLCSIRIVRYSRFSPSTSRFSRFTTVPAPWWGYTTLSPTLYKLTPSPVGLHEKRRQPQGPGNEGDRIAEKRLKSGLFQLNAPARAARSVSASKGSSPSLRHSSSRRG